MEDCLELPRQLFNETRIRPEVLNDLLNWLVSNTDLKDSRVSAIEKVMTFFYICGHGSSWRNVEWKVAHLKETISRYVAACNQFKL